MQEPGPFSRSLLGNSWIYIFLSPWKFDFAQNSSLLFRGFLLTSYFVKLRNFSSFSKEKADKHWLLGCTCHLLRTLLSQVLAALAAWTPLFCLSTSTKLSKTLLDSLLLIMALSAFCLSSISHPSLESFFPKNVIEHYQ